MVQEKHFLPYKSHPNYLRCQCCDLIPYFLVELKSGISNKILQICSKLVLFKKLWPTLIGLPQLQLYIQAERFNISVPQEATNLQAVEVGGPEIFCICIRSM